MGARRGNVSADIGLPDPGIMLVKAQRAFRIGEIIKRRRLTQVQAAEMIGLGQPELSGLLRAQFRGISETRMVDCLARLGRDVTIAVGPARRRAGLGPIAVQSR